MKHGRLRGMKKLPLNIAQGQIGVYRVLSALIARGHAPYIPVVDTGIDILLSSGVRIQVKTTQRQTQHWRFAGAWSFTLSVPTVGAQRQYVSTTRKFSAEVDFVILHASEANRFWIVPAAVLDNRHTVCFKDGVKQWRELDEVEINRLRGEGYTIEAIAEKFAVAPKTVQRRLTTYKKPRRKFAEIHQYEDRWDLITGVVDTLKEAVDVVQSPAVAVAETN